MFAGRKFYRSRTWNLRLRYVECSFPIPEFWLTWWMSATTCCPSSFVVLRILPGDFGRVFP
jgi:hypothetical protein